MIVSLGRAALMGGVAGLGAACIVFPAERDRNSGGSLILLGVITGVALQTLALCFGGGAAYGAGLGLFFVACILPKSGANRDDVCPVFLGGALVGAVIGGIFG